MGMISAWSPCIVVMTVAITRLGGGEGLAPGASAGVNGGSF